MEAGSWFLLLPATAVSLVNADDALDIRLVGNSGGASVGTDPP